MIQSYDRARIDTKTRILDAAEKLFAEHGFAATSLRLITTEAKVNLAAVNYHFRSKESLLQAVFERRLGPLNCRRLEMLAASEVAAGGGPLPLESVIRAFIDPVLRLRRDPELGGVDFKRLLGRMHVEPGDKVRQILADEMREIVRRFTAAFRRALPGLPAVELLWRLHFGVGVLMHTMSGADQLERFSGGLCNSSDVDATIERMVAFLGAGLRAPFSSTTTRN